MKTKQIFNIEDLTVSVERSAEKDKEIVDALVDWYVKHRAFGGECIMQTDDPQIDAAPLLSDIADDYLQFDVRYNDDNKDYR